MCYISLSCRQRLGVVFLSRKYKNLITNRHVSVKIPQFFRHCGVSTKRSRNIFYNEYARKSGNTKLLYPCPHWFIPLYRMLMTKKKYLNVISNSTYRSCLYVNALEPTHVGRKSLIFRHSGASTKRSRNIFNKETQFLEYLWYSVVSRELNRLS